MLLGSSSELILCSISIIDVIIGELYPRHGGVLVVAVPRAGDPRHGRAAAADHPAHPGGGHRQVLRARTLLPGGTQHYSRAEEKVDNPDTVRLKNYLLMDCVVDIFKFVVKIIVTSKNI